MTPRELLATGAGELGVALTAEQVNSLFLYLAELRKWNRKINLTAITEERDIVIKHVLDSLAYTKGFSPAPGVRLLDMGSGAGFPAIPLKIAFPGIAITLVESVKKKASFLRHIVRTLELDHTDIQDVRIEELPEAFRAFFDVVTARAFAEMGTALIAGTPFLKSDGRIVLSRGPEETAAETDLAKAGVVVENKIAFTLPQSDYKRVIWVFKRSA